VELDAAKRGPRHHVVVEALRDEIVSGRLAPGERLIEERLSTELGTTRGAVREALRRLEHEGLVMSFPYRGSVVLGVSEEEVHEVLMPIRVTLERYCFSKALPLLSRDDFAELGKCVWSMEEAARGEDLNRIVEADLAFHETVLERAHQSHALQIWRSIAPRIRAYFLRYGKIRGLDLIVDEHRELLAALQTRDPELVLPLLHEHIVVESPQAEGAPR